LDQALFSFGSRTGGNVLAEVSLQVRMYVFEQQPLPGQILHKDGLCQQRRGPQAAAGP
jgi:hypothetical protein